MTTENITPEQKENMKKLNISLLETKLASIAGANGLYALGEAGKDMSDKTTTSQEFAENRNDYWELLKQNNSTNMRVEMPTNQSTINYGLSMINEITQKMTLGDLYNVIQKVSKTPGFELADTLKSKSLENIAEELKEVKGDIRKLKGESQKIGIVYQQLTSLYAKKATEKFYLKNNGAEELATIKSINDSYAQES